MLGNMSAFGSYLDRAHTNAGSLGNEDLLLSSAQPFGADELTCALTLTGKSTPTPDELATALTEMYPDNDGPTVADLLTAGLLELTIDGRGLRYPPLTPSEIDARLIVSMRSCEYQLAPSIEGQKIKAVPPKQNEKQPNTDPLFSYYKGGIASTVPYAAITPAQLFTVLTSGRHRAATEALRAAPLDSPRRTEIKLGLDYITPAGTFTRRENKKLQTPSGLLVLDFDHLPDVAAARTALLADGVVSTELVLLFTSPSGDGLKVLAKTDSAASHLENFHAYADYLAAHYGPLGLRPDKAGKDVARACFVPYAPDAWLAPAYQPATYANSTL